MAKRIIDNVRVNTMNKAANCL